MSKKIPVLNSPWGRDYERPSDCARWIQQGHAEMIGGALSFTEAFFKAVQRMNVEFDPVGGDDGIARRWVMTESGRPTPGEAALDGKLIGETGKLIVVSPGGLAIKQLKPVNEVGTGAFVSKRHDRLERRQHRRARTLTSPLAAS